MKQSALKQMAFLYFILFILIVSTSCQKSGNQSAIVSGMNGHCVNNPNSCNTSAYHQAQGFSVYNSNAYGNNGYGYANPYGSYNPFTYYNNSAYLCSCPYGSVPTFNTYAGLGCVQLPGSLYGYSYLGWGHSNWNPVGQLSYYNSCYSGAVQSCTINNTVSTSCPMGYVCRAHSGNSNLGLCVYSYR